MSKNPSSERHSRLATKLRSARDEVSPSGSARTVPRAALAAIGEGSDAADFTALGKDRSTLAIYSRSVYGRSDFGANEGRITDWLARLSAQP